MEIRKKYDTAMSMRDFFDHTNNQIIIDFVTNFSYRV